MGLVQRNGLKATFNIAHNIGVSEMQNPKSEIGAIGVAQDLRWLLRDSGQERRSTTAHYADGRAIASPSLTLRPVSG